jgi:hypothetical protein
MRLERIGSSFRFDHQAESSDYSAHSAYRGATNDNKHIHNHFLRFGTGPENANEFRVSLDWPDVEAIIRAFSQIGYPEAVRLERARKLATAVEEFAKNSN